MTTPKGDGVMVMPDPMVNGEYAQDQVIEDWWHQGLSYDLPDLGTLENFHPAPDMKVFFQENMEFGHMTEEVMMAWEMLAELEAKEEEAGREEGW